jgi:hypothetical protein
LSLNIPKNAAEKIKILNDLSSNTPEKYYFIIFPVQCYLYIREFTFGVQVWVSCTGVWDSSLFRREEYWCWQV